MSQTPVTGYDDFKNKGIPGKYYGSITTSGSREGLTGVEHNGVDLELTGSYYGMAGFIYATGSGNLTTVGGSVIEASNLIPGTFYPIALRKINTIKSGVLYILKKNL